MVFPQVEAWLVFATVGILVAFLVLALSGLHKAHSERKTGIRREMFKRVFGFWPPVEKDEIRVAQYRVDATLTELAIRFDGACRTQQEADKHYQRLAYPPPPAPEEGRDLEKEVARLQAARRAKEEAKEKVGETKRAFWEAHGLAKSHGFRVRRSYTDYLLFEICGGLPLGS